MRRKLFSNSFLLFMHVAAGNYNRNQELITGTMLQTEKLLKTLEDNPWMEGAPTVLEGCLNRIAQYGTAAAPRGYIFAMQWKT
jgi:hypothetical protein